MPIRFGRPVIRFLTDLLYLPVGESPMELDDRVSGVADILQQGWARRRVRFSSSGFPLTTIGVATPVCSFVDDPAFVSVGVDKAIVQPSTNRLVILNWTPANYASGGAMSNPEAYDLVARLFLFNGASFNGLAIPADGLVLQHTIWQAAATYRGLFPIGLNAASTSLTTLAHNPLGVATLYIPAGWGMGVQVKPNAGAGNWTAATDFGELRSMILDVPAEVKPY